MFHGVREVAQIASEPSSGSGSSPAPSTWGIIDRQVLSSLLGTIQQQGCLKRWTQATAPDSPFLSKSLPVVVTHTTVPSQIS